MSPVSRKIAAVVGADSTTTQSLLAAAAARWRRAGARVVGVIAEPHNLPDRSCAAGYLRDIASGKSFTMYLEAAPNGTSCHLDAAGVEAACDELRDQLAACDVVVLSKFGKLEAMHKGLAAAFDAAIAAGKPILTSVSEKHRDAWRAVAPDAVELAADDMTLQAWWRAQSAH